MSSSSDDEGIDDLDFEGTPEADDEIDEDILDQLEEGLAAEADEADEDSDTDDSDAVSDDDDDDENEALRTLVPPPAPVIMQTQHPVPAMDQMRDSVPPPSATDSLFQDAPSPMQQTTPETLSPMKVPSPVPRIRSLSPAGLRRQQLISNLVWPRSFQVEAICAIPHPVPTHSLASSLCMTHLITGSDDGYIRDYDIYSSVNGKVLLSAPQRHHCGVMEGVIKAAQLRYWWENPADARNAIGSPDESPLCAPYSMVMQSDALWSLAGTDQGHINLFTVRHEPGRHMHTLYGHRGPVSSMCLRHDEKGLFSAGWDGEALEWDLNTGTVVRNYNSHSAQLTTIAVRPLEHEFTGVPWVGQPRYTAESILPPNEDGRAKHEESGNNSMEISEPPGSTPQKPPPQRHQDDDARSDVSFDPLFDEPEADLFSDNESKPIQTPTQTQAEPVTLSVPLGKTQTSSQSQKLGSGAGATAPKNAPAVLDSLSYTMFSPDVLMTAYIDGQVILWDRRVNSPGNGVGRLWMSERTPPWCVSACWSADGSQIYAGRRNGTIDVWDVRQTGQAFMGTPRILKVLRNPVSSGVVSCVVALPDGRHIACASSDNIRLWNVAEAGEPDAYGKMKSGVQFKIIPGHHGGYISQMLVDRQGRFLVSASSNRGWHGDSSKTVFVHEIKKIW